MQSKAKTVKEYLDSLPEERRLEIEIVRKTILGNLPKGYEEIMQYGMITYVVPLKLYPKGYLGKSETPLPYAMLASQKDYMSIYLMNIYGDKEAEDWFFDAYEKSGMKLDMGKSCVRFKKLEDLPIGVIGKAIARTPVKKFIEQYEKSRSK